MNRKLIGVVLALCMACAGLYAQNDPATEKTAEETLKQAKAEIQSRRFEEAWRWLFALKVTFGQTRVVKEANINVLMSQCVEPLRNGTSASMEFSCWRIKFSMQNLSKGKIRISDDGTDMHAYEKEVGNCILGGEELTEALYNAFVNGRIDREKTSVKLLSEKECKTFIDALNAKTGLDFRLPTVEEWVLASATLKDFELTEWCEDKDGAIVGYRKTAQGRVERVNDKDDGSCTLRLAMGPKADVVALVNYNEEAQKLYEEGVAAFNKKLVQEAYDRFSRLLNEPLFAQTEYITAHPVAEWCTKCIDKLKSNEVSKLTILVKGIPLTLVSVKGGTFKMGASRAKDVTALPDEMPVHDVTLSNFCISDTEVTQRLWKLVMDGKNPSRNKNDDKPVENVSWDDCKEFIARLNALTGLKFRLPTEAEWEYAARGGVNYVARGEDPNSKEKYFRFAGSIDLNSVGWHAGNSSGSHPVKAANKANELHIYDMSGNVAEWCNDYYGKYPEQTVTDPRGPEFGTFRVARGGGWYNDAQGCRVTYRDKYRPTQAVPWVGFRLAM